LGNQIRGGGKVVKNAAGFDFPKLFNGSLGRLGILTEVSFKVFPEPQSYVTLKTPFDRLEEVLGVLPKLKGFDLEGVEIDPGRTLFLRLGFQEPTMAARKQGLETLIAKPLTMTTGVEEPNVWQQFKSLHSDQALYKIATNPKSALQLLESLKDDQWSAHISNGAKSIHLTGPGTSESLDARLKELNLSGLQLTGKSTRHPLIGQTASLSFVDRIKGALDPENRFLSFHPIVAEPVQ
jgi:glycolate oxidase FAD binding subunit